MGDHLRTKNDQNHLLEMVYRTISSPALIETSPLSTLSLTGSCWLIAQTQGCVRAPGSLSCSLALSPGLPPCLSLRLSLPLSLPQIWPALLVFAAFSTLLL